MNDSRSALRARCLAAVLAGALVPPSSHAGAGSPDAGVPTVALRARIVAVGLPGVAGVRQIGRFHHGGPIPANPEFLLQTDAGRVLDPQRLLVALASNLGAPPAVPGHAPGTVLSIDPRAEGTLVVPGRLGSAAGQARDAGGGLQIYSAQSAPFVNARHSPDARYAATSGPRYLSINDAFGRPWIANAPEGPAGAGSVSVVDPDGAPLANAPSDDAGGVFAGRATDRRQVAKGHASAWWARWTNYRQSLQLTPGSLDHGALGTAFLGASPDGSGPAVFAVATADGAITQVHVQDGVDGLAPAGSVLRGADEGGVIGMAFKWNPQRVLYVADAGRNRLLLLHLEDDRRQFRVARTSEVASPLFDEPVDVAAALPEVANPGFSSHTSLAGGSDLYVANRGDGSLLRIGASGRVLARAVVELPGAVPVGGHRLRALAVSADAQRLWLTLQGEVPGFPGKEGALIEVSAFHAGGAVTPTSNRASATAPAATELAAAGKRLFHQQFTPESGLGPTFNQQSCVTCHPGPGGSSTNEEHFARRIARMEAQTGRVVPMSGLDSPVARRHSARELGQPHGPAAAVPHDANVSSLRMPIALFGSGGIDRVADAAIEAQAVAKGDGIKGRVHRVSGADGAARIGRFGWKADIASLDEMVAEAFDNELGMTSALAARPATAPRDDGRLVRAVSAYLRGLTPPTGPAR